jgi:hypothetical protein
VKTKLKRTLLLAAVLLSAVGCGGSDSGAPVTYVYESASPNLVAAQTCILVLGPITVGNGWMHYAIDDSGAGTDSFRAVIISDSAYALEQCDFGESQLAPIADVSFTGSTSGGVGAPNDFAVPADAYDFVVTCGNSDVPCAFNLTWNATY